MNDDFLYKRQEAPEPAFVARLHEELQSMGVEEKPKRKNGQRRFGWQYKLAAALFVFLVAGLVVFSQPKLRNPLINIFIDDPNYDVMVDAYNRFGIVSPEVPSRYTLVSARLDADANLMSVRFNASDHICVLELSMNFTRYNVPTIDVVTDMNVPTVLDENHVQVGDTVISIYDRSREDVRNARTNRVFVLWPLYSNNREIAYVLETGKGCLNHSEMIAIAQSTLPESP